MLQIKYFRHTKKYIKIHHVLCNQPKKENITNIETPGHLYLITCPFLLLPLHPVTIAAATKGVSTILKAVFNPIHLSAVCFLLPSQPTSAPTYLSPNIYARQSKARLRMRKV